MHKANQFIEAADMIRELADGHEDVTDAYVTLCVHAGIAASDVICCARLGEHAQGENHDEAISLLTQADRECAKHLRTLLKLKTKAGYSHTPATADEFKRAGRAAQTLVETARRVATVR
ncbi:hypothetical protein [Amycolatopsis azurea]|uniref:HEPN domain-containing protein n=1 Tax=Amycolatopsis azurea DSM 43854 TaxID=1238180 RepID=M2PUR5_9PSEU|nr:hypothetical protein [Amycolatopsis azurea]EMD23315.1 hypothetical protein C791_7405 [Amycolatopsis azurea DSM 43854]OOC03591.1 hypothetical protein B0293_26960 [Amycolatopsis azurea DSM 43854]